MLTAEHVTVRYGAKVAVDDLSFRLEAGQWLMLVGPNGAGKSSLIKAVAQTIPHEGAIALEGADLGAMRPADRARAVGVVSQHNSAQYAYTVEEIVRLGRYAHRRGFFQRPDEGDEEAVSLALERTGMTEYRRASILALSGGELQRAFLAQAFAQDPNLLILDEPTNHLDLKYQQHILDLVAQWLRRPGRAVVSVVHDLGLARRYGTLALLMDRGKCVALGEIGTVLSRENLERVYEMDVYGWMRGLFEQWR